MEVRTRNGVFANQGHGGGVFNLNTAFGAYDADATPVSGLGNIPATPQDIPEHCGQSKAYQDCAAVAWQEATSLCEYCKANPKDDICSGFVDSPANLKCINAVAMGMAWDNCVPSFCASADPNAATPSFLPYQVGDGCGAPNTIQNVQHMTGSDPDGVWGPLSQEAYDTNKSVFGSSYCDLVPGCTGISPIGPGCDGTAAPVPVSSPAAPPLVDAPLEETDKGMSLMLGFGLVAAAMAGAWFLMPRSKTR